MMNHKDSEKHFDIAKPNSVSASPTSRPAIIDNNNKVEDPMMRSHSSGEGKQLAHKQISIKPLTKQKQDEPTASVSIASEQHGTLDSKPSDSVDDSITEHSKIIDPSKTQTSTSLEQLISSKKYQLPIHKFGQQRKLSLVFFIILTAVAVGAALFVIITS